MARLYLKLDDVPVREFPLSNAPVTIGRLPDNTIHLDDVALSGRHARIVKENGQFVLYDEGSTNGTYLNGHKVSRAVLAKGDVVHIARHSISFSDEDGPDTDELPAPQAEISAPFEPVRSEVPPPITKAPAPPVGVLKVFSGKTDKQEYRLSSPETVIGTGEAAGIRLRRWFAPRVATTIHLRHGKYYIAPSQSQTPVRVNSEVVRAERELSPGDTILVDKISLLFDLKP